MVQEPPWFGPIDEYQVASKRVNQVITVTL